MILTHLNSNLLGYNFFIFTGYVKPLAGSGFKGKKDGIGQTAKFYHPSGLTFDRRQRRLFVADQVLDFFFCL